MTPEAAACPWGPCQATHAAALEARSRADNRKPSTVVSGSVNETTPAIADGGRTR